MDRDTRIQTELSSQLPSIAEQFRTLHRSSFKQLPSRTRRDNTLKPLAKPAAIQNEAHRHCALPLQGPGESGHTIRPLPGLAL
jgi:hypothetical protein